MGIAGFIITVMALFFNIKEYKKTGKLPEISNIVDRKIEGLKYIFRGFKNK